MQSQYKDVIQKHAGRYFLSQPIRFALVFALSLSSCTHRLSPPRMYETQRELSEYIDSGRYEQDFSAVTKEAAQFLEKAELGPKNAIVLDIDETSLSNWKAYRLNGFARVVNGPCDLEKGPCGLRSWQALGVSPALPATVALARIAKARGFSIFFISARPPELREATERNLREAGYVYDELIIQRDHGTFSSAVDFKAPERKRLVEAGYKILLCMGDQQSDLDGGYCERTFKLPNPVYFLP